MCNVVLLVGGTQGAQIIIIGTTVGEWRYQLCLLFRVNKFWLLAEILTIIYILVSEKRNQKPNHFIN